MLAEVAYIKLRRDEIARALREDDLRAMSGSGNPCGHMHIKTDVVVPLSEDRLTGVDANTHADGTRSKRLLAIGPHSPLLFPTERLGLSGTQTRAYS